MVYEAPLRASPDPLGTSVHRMTRIPWREGELYDITDLPDDRNGVSSDLVVRGNYEHVVSDGLCDDDAVERISVDVWESKDTECCAFVNGQCRNAVALTVQCDVSLRRIRKRDVSFSVLYDNLPSRRCTKENLAGRMGDHVVGIRT